MFFRRGIRHDRWLETKIALFSLGALLAVVGMALTNDWIIGAAGLILGAGFILRFAPRADDETPPHEPDPSDNDAP